MKNIGLTLVFLIACSSAFGQQFLWSTVEDSTSKWERSVPLNKVSNEVLNYYDQYRYYYDFSGYSKERFIEEFDYGFDDWKWLKDIKSLQVFSLKSNTGQGSLIIVMCINENNADAVIFSNSHLQSTPMFTSTNDRKKFTRWFKTLLK